MIVNEQFLALIPGTIGEVWFRMKREKQLPESMKQKIRDKFVNMRMRAYLNNFQYGMLGDNPSDPLTEFMKARDESLDELVRMEITTVRKPVNIQVGQTESKATLEKIESDERFIEWDLPAFVIDLKNSVVDLPEEE